MAEVDALRRQAKAVADEQQVVDRLNRLAEVLSALNPSRTNLELSLHIDAIHCNDDAAKQDAAIGGAAKGGQENGKCNHQESLNHAKERALEHTRNPATDSGEENPRTSST